MIVFFMTVALTSSPITYYLLVEQDAQTREDHLVLRTDLDNGPNLARAKTAHELGRVARREGINITGMDRLAFSPRDLDDLPEPKNALSYDSATPRDVFDFALGYRQEQSG